MFKPAIRLNAQDFDAINTRLDQGTRLGDYMAGELNAQNPDASHVSYTSGTNGGSKGVRGIPRKKPHYMGFCWFLEIW